MPDEATTTSPSGLDIKQLLLELEAPFSPEQVQWRVTNTTNDKKRGHVVPYADPRAYTDRLNTLFTPQGWTREYKVETMSNITRLKKGEAIVSGKVLVTCTVTIIGLGSHSGTGEEWADDDNGMTSADAQAFKRACSCFGLGRYFYDITAIWVDLDQHSQPVRPPALSGWALPENWRKGKRPEGKNGSGRVNTSNQGIGSNGGSNGNHRQTAKSQSRSTNGGGNGHAQTAKSTDLGNDLDARRLVDVGLALSVLDQISLIVEPVDRSLYEDYQEIARARVLPRDPDDWPVAAVALLLGLPIWTEDQDFFGSGIATWTTDRVELFLREL